MHNIKLFLFLTLLPTIFFCETNETKPKPDSQENSSKKQEPKDHLVSETESLLRSAIRFSAPYDPELYDFLYESAPIEVTSSPA